MKTIFTLLATLFVLNASSVFAGTTYTIGSNETWATAGIPSSCTGCTINIGTGYTLTLGANTTCMNCVFNGGTVSLTSVSLSLLYSGATTTTYFNSTNLVASGTATIAVNAPLYLTSSTWTFNNTSSITSSYEVDLSSSRINLYDASNWTVNGGPFNMFNTSQIFIGNGTLASTSFFKMNGPTLNIYDNSYLSMGNQNNYYFNWGTYNYYASHSSGTHTNFSTTTTLNCNSGSIHSNANSCSGSNTYGPSTISSGGTTASTTLALVLVTFSAETAGNNTVDLAWSTQMESNTSHFTIERSADGIVWNEIGETAAKGISSTVSDYSFTDSKPLSGVNYYRLQMVNLDGSFGYTDVEVVRTSIINNISFFPNPARDFVNVSLGQSEENEFTLRLYNQSGQLLQEKQVSGANGTIVTFAIQQYTAGIYILNVTAADGTRENSKILIAR